MTPSEELVAQLCQQSFLRLWTHPNPVGKNGKELCDCLVVCGAHILIISVKEIEYKDTGDAVGWERWHRAAVDASVKQIWGAERWLRVADRVLRKDGRAIELPPKEERIFHRLTVSLGGRGAVPLRWGDFGHGFVHLLDEYSLAQTFGELDTITDFVNYLAACEALFRNGVRPIFSGAGAEDLLAMYVRGGPDFGIAAAGGRLPDMVIIDEGIWATLLKDPHYLARNADLESSYAWDRLIEHYAHDLLTDGMFDMHSKEVTKNELALVAMALQPRGHRANLADAFVEFLGPNCDKVAARSIVAANATAFVFLGGDSEDREFRARELALRCLVVRGRCDGLVTTVVGIATDRPRQGKRGHSSDILYLHMPDWTEKDAKDIDGIQADLGYFKNTKWPARKAQA
ncbi:MAG: hypothetical protein QM750_30175 [Rubrivivax sp.]